MRVLIIGNLNGQIGAASKIAMGRGAKVQIAESIDDGLSALRGGRGADVALIDVGLDIRYLVDSLKSERINLPVVACGVGADARMAVAAIRAGAKEYLPLPPEPELIAAVLEAVAADSHQMLHRDPRMAEIVRLAEQIAPANASILVTGESGTGKEVLARHIHLKSQRADKPFVSINCAAIPEALLESELFGHEKGAFTGAVARRIGKFEEADGGTLLLDEISEMDARLQAKLLRAIQERVIDRVGGAKPVPVNIRIIATSNRDLAKAVAEGTFREDLLYRLNVVNLRLPSLRERPGDIAVLADHFVKKYAAANGVPPRAIGGEARRALVAHRWPGNVRELENAMHRAVLLATGAEIDVDAIRLPDGRPLLSGGEGASTPAASTYDAGVAGQAAQVADAVTRSFVGQTVAEMEKTLILDTLSHCLGNRTHAATILGISIRTLRNKLNEYADQGTPIPAPQSGVAAAYGAAG